MTSTQQKTTKKTETPVTAMNGHTADDKPTRAEKAKYQPFLNGTQENIAELIGDLLIAGGTQGNIETLVDVALSHEAHRLHAVGSYSQEQNQKLIQRWVNDRRQTAIDDLATARANRPALPKQDRPEPKTIAERIRAASRESLKRQMADFLWRASAEEVRLLDSILTHWDPGPFKVNPYGEIPLADAFCYELGEDETYLRVPNRLAVDVQAYLATLMKLTSRQNEEELAS